MNNRELVSAFADGELNQHDGDELIQKLKQDTELTRCWQQFHLIGDTIRNNTSMHFTSSFSDRMSLALENEPVHFPSRNTQTSSKPSPKRYSSVTSFAMAASVSAIAIVGLLQVSNQPEFQPQMAPVEVAYITDVQAQHQAVSQAEEPMMNIQLAQIQAAPASDDRLHDSALAHASFDGVDTGVSEMVVASTGDVESDVYEYLVNYGQYAVAAPLDGVVPNVSVASYSFN